MTEKQGGSDVRANTTRAEPVGDGWFELHGHKWFCSYPPCDDLPRARAGARRASRASCVERGAGMEFQRLKDKLGTRSLPSSEVEFRGAAGAAAGRGGPRRGDDHRDGHAHAAGLRDRQRRRRCAAASPRRSGTRATAPRSARGWSTSRRWSTCSPTWRWSPRPRPRPRCGSRAPTTRATPRSAASRTAIAKYWVCKRATPHAAEALECLGGNGYVEESPMPRLLRDAPLNGIWEGSGNVIALDVLRALAREPDGLAAFLAECELARGGNAALDAHLDALPVDARPVERAARGRGAGAGVPGVAAGALRAAVRRRRVLRRAAGRRRPRLRHAAGRRGRRGDRRPRATGRLRYAAQHALGSRAPRRAARRGVALGDREPERRPVAERAAPAPAAPARLPARPGRGRAPSPTARRTAAGVGDLGDEDRRRRRAPSRDREPAAVEQRAEPAGEQAATGTRRCPRRRSPRVDVLRRVRGQVGAAASSAAGRSSGVSVERPAVDRGPRAQVVRVHVRVPRRDRRRRRPARGRAPPARPRACPRSSARITRQRALDRHLELEQVGDARGRRAPTCAVVAPSVRRRHR